MAQPASGPIPEGMHSLTTMLTFNGNCAEAIEWYKRAFNATQLGDVAMSPDGQSVWHVTLTIGDSHVMLNDAMPGSCEVGPGETSTAGLWLFTEDCDAVFAQASAAGASTLMPLMDAFWGDRMGKLRDPFGHCWAIATRQWNYTPEEVQANLTAWLASMQQGG